VDEHERRDGEIVSSPHRIDSATRAIRDDGSMPDLDPRLRAYVERAASAPPVAEIPLDLLRAGPLAELPEVWGQPEDVDRIDEIAIGELSARIYRPASDALLPALVWLHGGGWVVGTVDTHDPLCRAIANRTPCVVVAPEYRLAPEHPFPAGLEDARTTHAWVAGHAAELGVDPARIAVGGDSAGGNLAAAVALGARAAGVPLALQVLVYPVTDHSLDTPSYRRFATGLNLTRAKMEWYWARYLGAADPSSPDASPLRAEELAGVAPALVQTAEHDPLLSEGEAYAERLGAAGVPVTLTRYDGMIHGFIRMPALVGEAREAVDEIARALREAGT
jgi:acetyl esterase